MAVLALAFAAPASADWSDQLTLHLWDAPADTSDGSLTAGRPAGGWFEWRFGCIAYVRVEPRSFNEYTQNHQHGDSLTLTIAGRSLANGSAFYGNSVIGLVTDAGIVWSEPPVTALWLSPGQKYELSLVGSWKSELKPVVQRLGSVGC